MREIKSIVIHCSDSEWGGVADIDRWHKERGWDGCGYHFVITNGVTKAHDDYKPEADGLIQNGRDVEKPGAHVRGHNKYSVGICLIGADADGVLLGTRRTGVWAHHAGRTQNMSEL